MIDHVKVGVSDLEAAKEYYAKALAPLGYRVEFEAEGMVYFADSKGLDFGVGTDLQAGGAHVGFTVPDPATVQAFYDAAIAAGGADNGPPGPRPEYGEDYYAAYVLDPDGNNVEALCHTSA
ncbi:MAG TPA: VOC family protein [Gaiellaceae bacterium]|nr:VOC family protein [Gaiellaceae bacterium]